MLQFCDRNSLEYPNISDKSCLWEAAQWELSCTELVPIWNKFHSVNSDTIDSCVQPDLSDWDTMALRTVRPHDIEIQLNHYGNWLRTVTGPMSNIYNVIEIYILIIIPCYAISALLLSPTFPQASPRPSATFLQTFLLTLCLHGAPFSGLYASARPCPPSRHKRLTSYSWTPEAMRRIWAIINEPDFLTLSSVCLLTAKASSLYL